MCMHTSTRVSTFKRCTKEQFKISSAFTNTNAEDSHVFPQNEECLHLIPKLWMMFPLTQYSGTMIFQHLPSSVATKGMHHHS